MRQHRILVVGATLVALLASACGAKQGSSEDFLELSWREFDQSADTGWRPVADRGDRARAARMIETYLGRKQGLENGQVGYLHFHCGQLWILERRDDRALGHFERASVDPYPPGFPRVWNEVVQGTIGFVSGDMGMLHAAIGGIHAMGTLSPRDSLFLDALEELLEWEGTPYAEVLESWMP